MKCSVYITVPLFMLTAEEQLVLLLLLQLNHDYGIVECLTVCVLSKLFMTDSSSQRYQFFDQHPVLADFRADIIQGLSVSEPYILPKYFYDEAGSRLFEEICATEEYYPTRAEAV